MVGAVVAGLVGSGFAQADPATKSLDDPQEVSAAELAFPNPELEGTTPAGATGANIEWNFTWGRAIFQHDGDHVRVWDESTDGRTVSGQLVWATTKSLLVTDRNSVLSRAEHANLEITEGKQVALRLCSTSNNLTICTAWRYGRA